MKGNKWFKLMILYLGATALSMSQLKISPIQESLGLELSSYTWLMSVFMVSALFLALPGGALISKFGAKTMGVVIMICLVLGNLLGALSVSADSVTNFNLLLFSRILEGVSFSMINLIAMVQIGTWFKDGSSGIAIGIFGTFSATASMVGMNVYLPIFRGFGLPAVWYSTAALAGVAALGFFFLLDNAVEEGGDDADKGSYKEVFADKNTWFLSVAMGCMSFILFTFLAVYPRILTEVFNLTIEKANATSGLFGLFGVPFGFIAGIIVDKFKIKSTVLGIATGLLLALSCFLTISIPSSLVLVQVFLLSAAISMFSSSVAISVPKTVKRPALIGQTFAVVYLFYYIGVFIGSPIIGKMVEASGSWTIGIVTMIAVGLLGAALMLYLTISGRGRVTN